MRPYRIPHYIRDHERAARDAAVEADPFYQATREISLEDALIMIRQMMECTFFQIQNGEQNDDS